MSITNNRIVQDNLDQTLKAWAKYHRHKNHIPRLGCKSWLGNMVRRANKDNDLFIDPDLTGYDVDFLDWLDVAIENMSSKKRRIMNLEYLNWSKDRAEIWARENGCVSRTYYRNLASIRDDLTLMITLRDSLPED